MFLFLFGAIALISVPLAGGRLSLLADLRLRHSWLIAAALAAQVLIITVFPDRLGELGEPAHMGTYLLAGAFLWANRRVPGLWLIGLGGAANFAAIVANGGVMPASEDALDVAGLSPDLGDEFANSALLADPELTVLGDVFAIPAAWPLSNVFSIGDLCIGVGLLVALHIISRSRLSPPPPTEQFRALVRHPQFARLWAAQATSSVGDFVYSLAVAVTVIGEGMGASLLATILIVQAAPAAITGLLGAPLIDAYSRKRLMVFADLARGSAVGSLLLVSSPSSAHILLVAACLGTFGAIFQPALHASLPNLVPAKLLVTANATISATFHLAVLIGPVLGGLLATYSGSRPAFAINAASFAVSALLLARMRIPQSTGPAGEGGALRGMSEGLRYVAGSAIVRVVAVTAGLAMFAAAMRQPLEPVLILDDLGGVARDIGLAAGAWGLGMLAGSCAVPALATRWRQETLMGVGLSLMGVAILVSAQVSALSSLLLLWLAGGYGNALLTITYETLLQQRTPDYLRGRVVAANEAVLDAALVAGLALAGSVAGLVGTRGVMAVSGTLLLLAALLVPLLLRHRGMLPGGNS
ncbi:MAG: MFS transporter, partial [Actinomycetota bacterium]|nr:MFS transporter [Actinomycetota bacterium]